MNERIIVWRKASYGLWYGKWRKKGLSFALIDQHDRMFHLRMYLIENKNKKPMMFHETSRKTLIGSKDHAERFLGRLQVDL